MGSQVADRLPTQQQLVLMKCISMVNKTKVCPESSLVELAEAIMFSHGKGYLYTNKEANSFVCGYRIPEINDKWKNTIPQEENGEIFFVNFAVSEGHDWFGLLKMLRSYLRENTDVKELVYFRRNNDKDFKKIQIRNRPV